MKYKIPEYYKHGQTAEVIEPNDSDEVIIKKMESAAYLLDMRTGGDPLYVAYLIAKAKQKNESEEYKKPQKTKHKFF